MVFESKESRVNNLIERLLNRSIKIYELEESLIEQLDSGDEAAREQLRSFVMASVEEFRLIGRQLNEIGGIDLMRYAYYKDRFSQRIISFAWHGIGDWQD